jgi:hypothetical protein
MEGSDWSPLVLEYGDASPHSTFVSGTTIPDRKTPRPRRIAALKSLSSAH